MFASNRSFVNLLMMALIYLTVCSAFRSSNLSLIKLKIQSNQNVLSLKMSDNSVDNTKSEANEKTEENEKITKTVNFNLICFFIHV
jgi:hypothetical protein